MAVHTTRWLFGGFSGRGTGRMWRRVVVGGGGVDFSIMRIIVRKLRIAMVFVSSVGPASHGFSVGMLGAIVLHLDGRIGSRTSEVGIGSAVFKIMIR